MDSLSAISNAGWLLANLGRPRGFKEDRDGRAVEVGFVTSAGWAARHSNVPPRGHFPTLELQCSS
jgi:hypothetical protein